MGTRAATATATLAAVLVLAGCAATGAPPPTMANSPAANVPTPTGGAHRPDPVYPVPCDELIPGSQVRDVAGQAVLRAGDSIPPTSLVQAAYRQAGGVDCEWADPTTPTGDQADGISLVIVPDALDDLRQFQQATGED